MVWIETIETHRARHDRRLRLEKLNADIVVLHPLNGGETHFHGRLVPGKIQHESEFLARPKQAIDTEPWRSGSKILATGDNVGYSGGLTTT